MNAPHSSTFSSEPAVTGKQRLMRGARLAGFMAAWLAAADVAVNLLFPLPADPAVTPNSLVRYFNHGRSTVGKLERSVGATPEESAPIVPAGWLDLEAWDRSKATALEEGHDLFLTVYGMSFAEHVCDAAASADGAITVRKVTGPAASPNHSYRAFELDETGKNSSDVAVFGILASSLNRMRSLSGMTWTPEHPAPFTFPRYRVDAAGDLQAITTGIETLPEFIEIFRERGQRWREFRDQLARDDHAFNRLVFDRSPADRSVIFRLLRRSVGNRSLKRAEAGLYDPKTGFNADLPEILALKLLVSRFAETCRGRGQIPVVLLFDDQGYGGHLHQLLAPHLAAGEIPFVSSQNHASPDDPANFVPDGHFTAAVDEKLAAALLEIIRPARAEPNIGP